MKIKNNALKVLVVTLLLIFSVYLHSQSVDRLSPLPGRYGVNPCPGDNISLEYMVTSDNEEKIFKEKRQLIVWLADRLLGEDPLLHGMKLGWNYSSIFRRSVEELYSDQRLEEADKSWAWDRGFLLGLRSGWFVKWIISSHIVIQPEVYYKVKSNNRQWQNIQIIDNGIYDNINKLELDYSLQYIKIPIAMRYKFKERRLLCTHISLGISVNINLHGTASWSYKEDGDGYESAKISRGRIDLDNLNKISQSLIAGLGIDHERFMLDIYYEYGLTDLNQPQIIDFSVVAGSQLGRFISESFDYKQYSLTITGGYKFSGRK